MHSDPMILQPRVAVVLAHFNGSRWIEDQLQSIEDQDYPNIDVFIFDDASQRAEKEFLASIVDRYKRIKSVVYRPSNLGFQMNFLEGLKEVKDEYDYYAFSDQDDIWYPNKISRAIEILSANNSDHKLYGSRTEIWCDKKKKSVGFSPLMKRPPSFGNALVQSIFGGNTTVFTSSSRSILVLVVNKPVSHDWLLYQLVEGIGGYVFYDPNASMLYRQHSKNTSGTNSTVIAKLDRFVRFVRGDFREYVNNQIGILLSLQHMLTKGNKELLIYFQDSVAGPLVVRIIFLLKRKIYRQGFFQNICLYLGFLLGKA